MKHIAKKIEAGYYEYRGTTIARDSTVPAGYFGAWRSGPIEVYFGVCRPGVAGGKKIRVYGHSMKEVKANIDRRIDG